MRLTRVTTRHWVIVIAVAVVAVAVWSVDAAIMAMALLVLALVARRPHPVHPVTAIVLTLLTGVLLWANLRRNGWQEEWGGVFPEGLDPITKAMFYRGWPVCPFMVWLTSGNRYVPDDRVSVILVLDGAVFVAALFATKTACERCLRWLRKCNG